MTRTSLEWKGPSAPQLDRVDLPTEFPPGLTFELPLWKARPREWLQAERRKDLWSYRRGFEQDAPREEDRLFSDLTKFLRFDVRVSDLLPDSGVTRYGGYDPAGETRMGNALVTAAVHDHVPGRVITDAQLWRGSYREDASRIVSTYALQRWALINAENVALQGAIIELVVSVCPTLPIAGFLTGKNKADLKFGVRGLEAEIRNGAWALCMGDAYDTELPLQEHDYGCACAYHTLIADLNNFPSPGRSYDLMMALWFCREAARGIAAGAPPSTAALGTPEDDVSWAGIPEDEVAGNFLAGQVRGSS